jgi:hypothetical protein
VEMRQRKTNFSVVRCRPGRPQAPRPGEGGGSVVANSVVFQVLVALGERGQPYWPAGVDGSRTHQGRLCSTPQTVLKTAEPTGTQPPPRRRILTLRGRVKQCPKQASDDGIAEQADGHTVGRACRRDSRVERAPWDGARICAGHSVRPCPGGVYWSLGCLVRVGPQHWRYSRWAEGDRIGVDWGCRVWRCEMGL